MLLFVKGFLKTIFFLSKFHLVSSQKKYHWNSSKWKTNQIFDTELERTLRSSG